jgi:hypothetical protein
MSNFERNMEKIFDVSPKEQPSPVENKTELVPIENIAPISEDELTSDLDKDYLESRKNLQQLVKKGNDAIEHLLAIATETEHPRAFEVVATLIKNTAEVNEKLMNMQKQIRDLKGLTKQKSGSVNVDKAIFVGSTSELSKLIKGKE